MIDSQLNIQMWIAKRIARYQNSFQKNHLFSIAKQVKDVIKLRGLNDNKPYIILEGTKVQFPPTTFLANINLFKAYQYCAFYDIHYNCFYPGTPILRIIFESFFIQLNSNFYFVFTNEPIIRSPKSQLFGKAEGSYMIEPMVSETLRELQGSESVDRAALHNHMMKNVVDSSDEIKLDKLRYKELLKVVQAKIALFDESIRIVEQKLKQKAERRVKIFSTFMLTQIAILHYFIYFNLSWDIMEPITVILANFDLFVAYYFFLLKGQSYSPEAWRNSIIQKKRMVTLKKEGVDVDRYEQLVDIRDDLKMRLGLLSKNPLNVLEAIQKPFKLIDTR